MATLRPGSALAALLADRLPLLLCERHRLRWRREASFKLELGSGLLPQRYVLGVDRDTIAPSTWEALLADLQPPGLGPELRRRLDRQFQQASTLYLGYEQGVNGANLRLYLEYWEQVRRRLLRTPAAEIQRWQASGPPLWPMGVGYKWPVVAGGSLRLSRYGVRPLLETPRILERAGFWLGVDARGEPGRQGGPAALAPAVLALLRCILDSDASVSPVFLEVDEPGTARGSFDLGVHRYRLRLGDVAAELQAVLASLLGPGMTLHEALRGGSTQAWLTHVSAGRSRHGLPYACFYYEPLEQG